MTELYQLRQYLSYNYQKTVLADFVDQLKLRRAGGLANYCYLQSSLSEFKFLDCCECSE